MPAASRVNSAPAPLAGRKVWIPDMSRGSCQAVAAALRSVDIDAECTPPADARSRELGMRHSSGDECYPLQIVLGDVLKVLDQPGTVPARTAIFLPTADGPCRFGQYGPYLRALLRARGQEAVQVISPDAADSYSALGAVGTAFRRTAWRAIVGADVLFKLLLKARPYEIKEGSADALHAACLAELCAVLEQPAANPKRQLRALQECLLRARHAFRALPRMVESDRPLIGIVGEVFCRLNPFSNDDVVRRLEQAGGEAWMSDITEWVWYTDWGQRDRLRRKGQFTWKARLGTWLQSHIQRSDEHALTHLFAEDFRGREEPEGIEPVLALAEPYLPQNGADGEMVVNAGRVVYLAHKGVDGILDISPFTCMNGIVNEAIYPRISADLGGIPIRSLYCDGTRSDVERDLGIYIELARAYRAQHMKG